MSTAIITIGGEPRDFRLEWESQNVRNYQHGDLIAWENGVNYMIRLHFGGRTYEGRGTDWPSAASSFEGNVNQHIDQLRDTACIVGRIPSPGIACLLPGATS